MYTELVISILLIVKPIIGFVITVLIMKFWGVEPAICLVVAWATFVHLADIRVELSQIRSALERK